MNKRYIITTTIVAFVLFIFGFYGSALLLRISEIVLERPVAILNPLEIMVFKLSIGLLFALSAPAALILFQAYLRKQRSTLSIPGYCVCLFLTIGVEIVSISFRLLYLRFMLKSTGNIPVFNISLYSLNFFYCGIVTLYLVIGATMTLFSLSNKFESDQNTKLLRASRLKRFINLVLDSFFTFLFAFIVCIALKLSGFSALLTVLNDFIYGLVFSLVYYVTFESLFGRTIAKYVTKTKVVTDSGLKPSFKNCLGRTLCRFVPFEAFSFLFGRGAQSGLHDSFSRTTVIEVVR